MHDQYRTYYSHNYQNTKGKIPHGIVALVLYEMYQWVLLTSFFVYIERDFIFEVNEQSLILALSTVCNLGLGSLKSRRESSGLGLKQRLANFCEIAVIKCYL